jgi:hypothetical protein
MQFMLAIYGDEAAWEALPADDERQMMEGYAAFGREAGERIVAGEALHPVAAATTVRVRDGERLLTDGPFAETREQLGGFYVVDVADIDEAIELATKIPGAATGCVEVRPVVVFAPNGQAASA